MTPFSKARRKHLQALLRKKGREDADTFLVEGLRAAREALSSPFEILEVYYTQEAADDPAVAPLLQQARQRTATVEPLTAREMDAVSDTVHTQGILAVLRQRHPSLDQVFQPGAAESVLTALDAVADPGNVGTIIRTCDWFGVHGVLLGRQSVDLYNPKVVRSTMGSLFHLPVIVNVDLPAALSTAREQGYRIYVADPGGETHFDRIRYDRKSVLVFGNEAWGVTDAVKGLADVRVSIRKYGAAESLNVGIACGIMLSTLHRLTDQ